jgi:hypothetical protein
MTPSNARGSRDVEMAELVPPITRLARKRKQQSDGDISISVEGSQVEQSDTRNATLETGPQEPPQVSKRPKRPQETVAQARPEDGLDLSKYEFEEKSRIGRELPMAEGKVSFASLYTTSISRLFSRFAVDAQGKRPASRSGTKATRQPQLAARSVYTQERTVASRT